MTRTPPKSRVPDKRVRVIVQPPKATEQGEPSDASEQPPGYSGHNGGVFGLADKYPRRGSFGFTANLLG